MLISGAGAGVDVDDMRANVQYAGGYHEEHPIVLDFWKVCPRPSSHSKTSTSAVITTECLKRALARARCSHNSFAMLHVPIHRLIATYTSRALTGFMIIYS